MKNSIILILIICGSTNLTWSQESLNIDINSSNSARTAAILSNSNNSSLSAITFQMKSGDGSDETLTNFTTFGEKYSASAGFGGYTALSNFSSGLIFRTTDSNSDIRFITGGPNINATKLIINAAGEIAVGSIAPKTKFHIQSGDLYLDNLIGSKIIMKSPDGNCFDVQVTNAGALTATAASCPN